MKQALRSAMALAVAAGLLAACGGGDDTPAAPRYARMVSFGDSLSDVGSYRTPGVQQRFGGGQFTVNSPQGGTNWTEQLARELALSAPCAARTGLQSSGDFAVLAAPVTDHVNCTNYAQGGARVTNRVGPGNAALLPDPQGQLGALTQPVKDQIARHLALSGGSFSTTDLVTVLAGGNDIFRSLVERAPAQVGAAVQTAGAELVALVRDQILAKGAQRVVLVLLPDIGVSPLVATQPVERRAQFAQQLTQLSLAFNVPLLNAFSGDPRVLLVDAFSASELQKLDPAKYGLGNATTPACDPALPTVLLCSPATTVAADVSKYWFADEVHPTPYGYQLLARVVTDTMTRAGWLAPSGSRPCNAAARGCTLAPLPQ
ncbi:hypothetical protein HHL10_02485 [Azohydromonas sp. G-1-1-14]|uniref:Phospholipase/lecithinase/hemolysin n=2 Tax=Azohydromonas caseinilytica TaxID=2728836 RepID=A0A848F193_9BURK|nr:hypothetical protein [Azohydromonas caseinilytica]